MKTEMISKIRNDYVSFMEEMAKDNNHGYSQAVRSLYNIQNPASFDCSSLTLTAIYYAFVKNGLEKQAQYLKNNCSYTGNMLKLQNVGFEVVAIGQTAHSSMIRGDIELNTTYHVCVATDPDHIVHARSSEGTSDTKDNSGNEIRVQPWYNYSHGWTHRLRFTGKGIAEEPAAEESKLDKKLVDKVDDADYFDKMMAGTYTCQASELNVRTGPGTNKTIITSIPRGKEVFNFGYYSKVGQTKWLLIQFLKDGVICTGFASEGATKGYLQKKAKA